MDCQSLALTMAITWHESKAGLGLLSFFVRGFATGCEANTKVFQAYDEGSIPFTRSNKINGFLHWRPPAASAGLTPG
jgi:hypothetical protein